MAALMCAHKPTRMYTFAHHLQFVCTHRLCLNKCTYTCTHAHTHCAFEKIRYFVKVLFLWILSFPIGYTSLKPTWDRYRHTAVLQGLYSDNTVRASSGLLTLSCQHVYLHYIPIYSYIFVFW